MDPKSDAGILKRLYIEAKRNNRPFYIFHLGFPDISCRYNAVGSFADLRSGNTGHQPVSQRGNSAAFAEFSWRFVNIVTQARVAMGSAPATPLSRAISPTWSPLFQ